MTDNVLAWIFWGGKLEQPVTSITLANNTAKDQDTTVPAGERWLLLSVTVLNPDNVTRWVYINIYKESGKTNKLCRLASAELSASSAEILAWPVNVSQQQEQNCPHIRILEEGNTINVHWAAGGASAGGTDADAHVIEYLRMPA